MILSCISFIYELVLHIGSLFLQLVFLVHPGQIGNVCLHTQSKFSYIGCFIYIFYYMIYYLFINTFFFFGYYDIGSHQFYYREKVMQLCLCLVQVYLLWHFTIFTFRPIGAIDYMVCLPAHGAIIGAWFGAWPMPLDWERPWQVSCWQNSSFIISSLPRTCEHNCSYSLLFGCFLSTLTWLLISSHFQMFLLCIFDHIYYINFVMKFTWILLMELLWGST